MQANKKGAGAVKKSGVERRQASATTKMQDRKNKSNVGNLNPPPKICRPTATALQQLVVNTSRTKVVKRYVHEVT